jgi:hypothetical protein
MSVFCDANLINRFRDSNTNIANEVYLNPRICCQNAAYNVPAGYCPIGVISQAYRKFQFTKLRVHYVPTNSTTYTTNTVAIAFEPSYVGTASLAANNMAYANFEASMYGPCWTPLSMDLTRFLDRSRWFRGEINSSSAANAMAEAVQGTLLLSKLVQVNEPNREMGMIWIDFELAMYELGPTEVSSQPALLAVPRPLSTSSTSSGTDSQAVDDSGGEFVHVSKNVLRSLGLELGSSANK